MELALSEIDATGRQTGREVFFANSYIFDSPAAHSSGRRDRPGKNLPAV